MTAVDGLRTTSRSAGRKLSGWFTRERMTRDNGVLAGIALITVLAHLISAGNYGYFRDELYYIAAGRHLAFGYVDFPPMIAWLAALLNVIAGDNLVVIHIVSALVIGCVVFLTGLMARELGGTRFAQALAATGSACSLVFLATGSIFSMDALDELWWALGAYVLIRLIRRDDQRLWIVFGLVAGLGVFTKLTMLFFGLGVTVGVLLTAQRRAFRSRWIWLGGAITLLFLLPYTGWNALNGWPTVAFWQNYGGLGASPVSFAATQVLDANPFTIVLWIPGLYFYLFSPLGKRYRAVGLAFVTCWLVLSVPGVKPYFLTPAYPMLFAGGAVILARPLAAGHSAGKARPWLRFGYLPVLVASGLLLLPLATPLLPPAAFVAGPYEQLAVVGNAGAGQGNGGQFPQYLGDRFGWRTMAADMQRVYDGLPASERSQACILAQNYGEASALDLYRTAYGLPPVISGHNSWFLWGPGRCSGTVLLTVGFARADLAKTYSSVQQAMLFTCVFCMGSENNQPLFVATQPIHGRLSGAWNSVKHFN